MNVVLLYLVLLKGTVTAFAGLASLPVIQESLVNHYHVLTNDQLNQAVVITRSSPGPVGLYIVSVGYFAAGLPGAIVGWLAMITPALLIIPLVHFVGRRMENPRVRSVLQTVVIASAGLLLAAAIPLGQAGLTGLVTFAIAAVCFVLLLTTKLDTLWMILAAALVSLTLFDRNGGVPLDASAFFCGPSKIFKSDHRSVHGSTGDSRRQRIAMIHGKADEGPHKSRASRSQLRCSKDPLTSSPESAPAFQPAAAGSAVARRSHPG